MAEHDSDTLIECIGCHTMFVVDDMEYCEDCESSYCQDCYREHECPNSEITGDQIVSEDGDGA